MIRTLVKKQLMELFSFFLNDRRAGKRRSTKSVIAFALIYLYLAGALLFMFGSYAVMLCEPLLTVGFGWLYFALMGVMATTCGVIGSAFLAFGSLYHAKDNDLLLSMPIPTYKILFARILMVYLMGLALESAVMLPTVAVYVYYGSPTAAGVIFSLLIPAILSLPVLAFSCLLGFLLAAIGARIKRKNLVIIASSLVFLALYFVGAAKIYELIGLILTAPQQMGEYVKSLLYPLYRMGLAAMGDWVSMLIFTVFAAVLLAVTWALMNLSFLKLATANRGTPNAEYKERFRKTGTVSSALLKKELRIFIGTPIYALNCGLGLVFCVVGAVAVMIKGGALKETLAMAFGADAEKLLPLLILGSICVMLSMCFITAPSVSLEGKQIWLVKSMPISPISVLYAKLNLQMILTLPVVVLLGATLSFVFEIGLVAGLLVTVGAVIFAFLVALLGLFLNLLMPNLTWKNPSIPVKQDMPVLFSMLGVWSIVALLGGLYMLIRSHMSAIVYLVLCILAFAAATLFLWKWLHKRGVALFEGLTA